MLLLDQSKYDKVIEPLRDVTINNLFARSVVEKKVTGAVYVDNIEMPKTFYVVHPYGMSLLFGKTDNNEFNFNFLDYALNNLNVRDKYEWLQAYPDSWNKKLSALFGDKLIKYKDNIGTNRSNIIEENTRVNFEFNKEKYLDFKSKNNNNDYKILRMDKQLYESMEGSVIAKYFWDDAETFCNYGVGYCLIYENSIVSSAFSSYIHDNQLELGIETIESGRGKGFAIHTCSSLIDYCLKNDYEPVWSCRLENFGSYKLALKLGFEETIKTPYYRLNN
jgi:RimJ/RimL family protein N-acetyltransferase